MGNNRLCSTRLGKERNVDSLLVIHVNITLLKEDRCEVAETFITPR
jgi:hypothetical protein